MKLNQPVSAPDCFKCTVRNASPFCGMLTEEELSLFMKVKKDHIYEKNQALFYQGNTSSGLYLLCSGSVKLVQSSPAGQQQIIEVISPGDWIDKGSYFASGRHSATAQAIERSEVCLLSGEDLKGIIQSLPGLSMTLIQALSQAVEKSRERSNHFISKSALARLADVLIELSEKHGIRQDEVVRIRLLLKREELAEMVGVTQETCVRLLTALKRQKLIALKGREIAILDVEKLGALRD